VRTSRGMFLSGLILFFASAISLATLALIASPGIDRAFGHFPDWFNAFLVIFLLARLLALSAIWRLKRWGVYAFLGLECLEVAMGLFVFASAFAFGLRLVTAVPTVLILFAIWYLALRPRWAAFA
jgi:hypothetical protein